MNPFVKGLKTSKDCQLDPQDKCPSCVIGKATKQENYGSIPHASRQLGKVNFDFIVSSIVSIERYSYGALYVDDNTLLRWLYRMKTRDEVVDVAKRRMAEIANLCEIHQLRVVMRDNAGENKSNELKDY